MAHARRSALSLGSLSRLGAVLAVAGATVFAPAPVAQTSDPDPAELLDDFIFYVYVANHELAEANARALLELELDSESVLALIEDEPQLAERFSGAYDRAIRVPSLEALAAELRGLYEEGRRGRARNPSEVSANVALLDGDTRQRRLGRQRLVEACEYAVPAVLEALMFSDSPTLRGEARELLVDMGPCAVEPLMSALRGVRPESQEAIADVLGAIGYPRALPVLYELNQMTTVPAVRDATRRAIERIEGEFNASTSLSTLFSAVGDSYYAESLSLTTFPGEEHQLLWEFIPGQGLVPTAIRSEVYHEARAMQHATKALELDPQNDLAVALWLRSNLSRHVDQPSDYENPAYPDSERGAMFYAVGAGATAMQRVLDRALADRDTPVARLAIEALGRSAGGNDLWEGLSGRKPLLEALSYPDRRVQLEAALVLADANPRETFEGHELVIPTLASAVRHAGERFALVLSFDAALAQTLVESLGANGWTVLAPASSIRDAEAQLADAPGIDIIVSALPGEQTRIAVEDMRRSSRLFATPIACYLDRELVPRLRERLRDDHLARVVEVAAIDGAPELADQLFATASGGGVDEFESIALAQQSLDALRALANSRSPVLRTEDAARPLIASLPESSSGVRRKLASVLATIDQSRAQMALVNEADRSTEPDDRVMLLNAASESARRHGNLLDISAIDAVRGIARTGNDDEATAAAALLGALNLPAGELVPFLQL
ncbi:MAG: HEAT repeat domain-containing protein [Planctomycetota bacterium]